MSLRKAVLVAAAILLPAAGALSAEEVPPPGETPEVTGAVDPARENGACDCCIQCRAARREATDGAESKPITPCDECCRKCGRRLPLEKSLPAEKEKPPLRKD